MPPTSARPPGSSLESTDVDIASMSHLVCSPSVVRLRPVGSVWPVATSRTLERRPAPRPLRRGGAGRAMRRLLRVPPAGTRVVPRTAAQRAFSTSMVVSGLRCLLTYVVLHFVAPAVGFAAGIGPVLGLVV